MLNDLDASIVAFFTALRDTPADLERVCRLTPYSRFEHQRARAGLLQDLPTLERARRFFAVASQGFGSVPATSGWSGPSRSTSEPAKKETLIRRFDRTANRLNNVYIERDDGRNVIERLDGTTTVHFVDPPYIGESRSWWPTQQRKMDYSVEMSDIASHAQLARTLRSARGFVLIACRESTVYDELYEGWAKIDLGHPTERLFCNQPGLIP